MLTNKNSKDSLCYRMESLKKYLERELGFDAFFSSYKIIRDANDNETDDEYDTEKLKKVLGEDRMGYLNVIVQLILVETDFNLS